MIWLLALLVAGNRTAIGVYAGWAAFRNSPPPHCFAVARPVLAGGRSDLRGGYAGVAGRFGRGGGSALFLRLSRPRRADAPVTLAIGERRFALVGDARVARAPDAEADRAIVAAMRGQRSMSVSAVDADGHPFADTYALQGAATAIDAAALACAGA